MAPTDSSTIETGGPPREGDHLLDLAVRDAAFDTEVTLDALWPGVDAHRLARPGRTEAGLRPAPELS